MSKKYQNKTRRTQAAAPVQAEALVPTPEFVQVAMADIAASMREGLLALAVSAGMQVMTAMMEESVTALCGPRGRHDADRRAVRHGSEAGSVVLGGRKVPVRRPRVRAADGSGEVSVPAYELFSGTELLDEMAVERMLGKLSSRATVWVWSRSAPTPSRWPRGPASRRSRGGSWPRPRPRWPS
jgi:hypothetical protein